jgi:putative protease
MIEHIPDMVRAGIDSLKIEGRMKNALYVATCARTYRKALDDLAAGREVYEANQEWYREQIRDCTFRPFTTGFFYGRPDAEAQIYDSNTYEKTCTYLGCVRDIIQIDGRRYIEITQKNKFSVGEEVELMGTDGEDRRFVIDRILDEEMKPVESAPHPQQKLYVRIPTTAERYDIMRRHEKVGNI